MPVTEINSKKITLLLAIAQGGYWSSFCAAYGFATVFLRSRGFSASQIGVIIAVASLLAVLLQPVFAGIADKSKRISIHVITALLLVGALIFFGMLLFTKNIFIATLALFIMANALNQTLQPFINAVSFYYINRGVEANFGMARSMGSLSYAIVSPITGELAERYGSNVIIIAGVLFFAITAGVVLIMPRFKDVLPDSSGDIRQKKVKSKRDGGIFSFFAGYKLFSLALVGSTLIFIFHCSTNNYMLQMAESLGGNASTMGIALAIAAAFEIPSMMFSYQIMKKIKYNYILIIAGVFFCIKAVLYIMATNITMLYISQAFQMVSYAFFLPASVFYVNYTMNDNDKVKGQALMTGTSTLGGVIGSLLGGTLIEHYGVRSMEWVGLVFAVVGTIVLFISVSGIKNLKKVLKKHLHY